jgi:hypothetical protein
MVHRENEGQVCEMVYYSVFSFGFMKIRSARNAVYRKAEPVSYLLFLGGYFNFITSSHNKKQQLY